MYAIAETEVKPLAERSTRGREEERFPMETVEKWPSWA